jgi:catechol 2,3-dioxygenase-like lactoylglutathione lyase family enzyme
MRCSRIKPTRDISIDGYSSAMAEKGERTMPEEKKPTETLGTPPRSGWVCMVVELLVNDLKASLSFWQDPLGFETAFERPEERFIYLEHPEGHQIMLCQRHGRFEMGPLEFPLGRGAMFQIYFRSIEPVLSALAVSRWPIYLGPREVWRKTGDCESGQREAFVQDPDGYLLMVAENIGTRPLLGAA